MSSYNTNLASEFYVLATLYRLGIDASLTLGNKKSVDILVVGGEGKVLTVDVKGVAGRYDWPADNVHPDGLVRHFYVFVSFEAHIDDPDIPPSVWVVPSAHVHRFLKSYRTRTVVSRSLLKNQGAEFKSAWQQLAQ